MSPFGHLSACAVRLQLVKGDGIQLLDECVLCYSTTFKALYSHVAKGGVYLVEDVATSYDTQKPYDGTGKNGTERRVLWRHSKCFCGNTSVFLLRTSNVEYH